jgi:hypothetical protein
MERLSVTGRFDFEAIPCVPGESGIALVRPAFAGPNQRPMGVIEARIGPRRIVSRLESLEPVKRSEGRAAGNKAKRLRVQAAADGENE